MLSSSSAVTGPLSFRPKAHFGSLNLPGRPSHRTCTCDTILRDGFLRIQRSGIPPLFLEQMIMSRGMSEFAEGHRVGGEGGACEP